MGGVRRDSLPLGWLHPFVDSFEVSGGVVALVPHPDQLRAGTPVSEGASVTRAEKVAEAQALRAQGLIYREIAERMGCTISTAQNYVKDPDLSRQRARQASYGGVCVDCGTRTDGRNGRQAAPRRCRPCHFSHVFEHGKQQDGTRSWGTARLIEAIRGWADRYGEPPKATDWNPAHARFAGHPDRAERFESDGCWPYVTTVIGHFGSWNAAIEAAGFRPRTTTRVAA